MHALHRIALNNVHAVLFILSRHKTTIVLSTIYLTRHTISYSNKYFRDLNYFICYGVTHESRQGLSIFTGICFRSTDVQVHLQVAFTQHLCNFSRQIHVTSDNAVILLRSEKVNARAAHAQ